ncbi:DUF503 domain-containing protein [Desulfuromonas sp. KJ2020]|uniref:DUF503 domain-containing protein n=1 Tax=Desulfuromonas sp. KJ2020 TaxID=2919173 RepID=UPI000325EA0F|nr:DUF503 domain-containing protein [Desulfuromonas sp. KJ2020]MCP3178112.1 DUF503 domain-containing protein [Desulfuromonas sp. KJ2020]
MVVGIMRLDLHLHAPQNLKEKRSVVKRIIGRCRERFPVSAAEVGSQDLWQRAEVGFCMVATSEADIQTVFSHIEDEIERLALADVLDQDTEFLHYS